MAKVTKETIDLATRAVGSMWYLKGIDAGKWKQFREMSGVTKGQWKRFQLFLKNNPFPEQTDAVISVDEVVAKKLVVMSQHYSNPHLHTLLKLVEAQGSQP